MITVVSRRTDQQLASGAASQMALLTALSVMAGLGVLGWLAGITYAAGLCVFLVLATRRAGVTTLGPADLVTLARAVLVGGVTALVADGLRTGDAPAALLVGITVVALALDAVDGYVARRSGTESPHGARFDMEVDSFLVLVLSVHVAALLGPWVLAVGLMRYAFVAASWALPWMRAPLPRRYSAKVVAALQGVALVVATSDVLQRPFVTGLVAVALVSLVWSFGSSVRWLWRNAHEPGPAVGRVLTAAACLLVFVALVFPNEPTRFTPVAFVRIPVEALLGVGLLLTLRARPTRVLAPVAGAALGLLVILKAFDLGFFAVLSRPFDPVVDWPLVGAGLDFLRGSVGGTGVIAAVVLAAVLAAGVMAVTGLAVGRIARVVIRNRTPAIRALAVVTPIWLACAVLGAEIVPDTPVASRSAASIAVQHALQVRTSLADQETFAQQIQADAFRNTAPDQLLTALRGKDVVVAFVESYGRSAITDPGMAPQVNAVLDDGTRRLAAAGFGSRSAFLTSPTAGGGSWLAHATLLSGVWVNNQQRYRTLVDSDRTTLTSAFRRANWQTAAVMPGTTDNWPEGAFYGYDRIHGLADLGYHGPELGWATVPDQYTLSAFQRSERTAPDRRPVMAELDFVSSHAPWPLIPRVVGWDEVGDGSIYRTMPPEGDSRDAVWAKGNDAVRAAYRRSIEYSLSSLVSYVEKYGDDNLVLVFLGDHQPAPVITGEGAGHDVPITIVARDHTVLDRISGWGWQDGLRPGPQAPVMGMDLFRDKFLTTFSTP